MWEKEREAVLNKIIFSLFENDVQNYSSQDKIASQFGIKQLFLFLFVFAFCCLVYKIALLRNVSLFHFTASSSQNWRVEKAASLGFRRKQAGVFTAGDWYVCVSM